MLQELIIYIFVSMSSQFSNFYVLNFRIIFGRTWYGTTVIKHDTKPTLAMMSWPLIWGVKKESIITD